jgi:hypothetical protein
MVGVATGLDALSCTSMRQKKMLFGVIVGNLLHQSCQFSIARVTLAKHHCIGKAEANTMHSWSFIQLGAQGEEQPAQWPLGIIGA